MHLFKTQLDEIEQLIEKGDYKEAAKKAEHLRNLGNRWDSQLAVLFERVRTFDSNLGFLKNHLAQGNKRFALDILQTERMIILEIHHSAKALARQEHKVEK